MRVPSSSVSVSLCGSVSLPLQQLSTCFRMSRPSSSSLLSSSLPLVDGRLRDDGGALSFCLRTKRKHERIFELWCDEASDRGKVVKLSKSAWA